MSTAPNSASWRELPQRMNAEILGSGILVGCLPSDSGVSRAGSRGITWN